MKFILPLRLPPAFRGHKNRFEFENWIHIFNPNFSIKKISEIFKNPKFFRKNVIKKKLLNQGGVTIADLGEPVGEFSR